MPPVPFAPSLPRVALAALASLLVVALISWTQPEAVAYGWGTPVIVGAGGLIWNRVSRAPAAARTLDTAMALLLLAPALAARKQATALALWQLEHLSTAQLLDGVLALCAQATADTGPLLAAGAAGYVVMAGRAGAPGLGVLIAAAAAAAGSSGALFAAREAATQAEYAQVGTLVRGVPWSGFLVVPGAILGVAFEGRASPWPAPRAACFALAIVGGVLAGTTPLNTLLAAAEVPETDVVVPEGPPGPTTARTAIAGDGPAIDRAFRERGHHHPRPQTWPCTPGDEPWGLRLRQTAALALAASAPVSAIDEAAAHFLAWTTPRLALVGRADPMPQGPLARLLAWPTVPLLLDRPAVDAVPLAVGRAGVRTMGPAPVGRAACALVPDDDARVDDLWQAGRRLLAPRGPCLGLALVPPVLRATTRDDPTWLTTIGCPKD
jgi:hypothetical protein